MVLKNLNLDRGHRRKFDTTPAIPAAGTATKQDNLTAKNSLDFGFEYPFQKKSLLDPIQHIPSKLPPNITSISEKARPLTHGMITQNGEKKNLFPIPHPVDVQVGEIKERVYVRRQKRPLGKAAPTGAVLPAGADFAFGDQTFHDKDIRETLYPNLPNDDLNETVKRLYKISHQSYRPGEHRDYHYDLSKMSKANIAEDGSVTHDGKNVKDSLFWYTNKKDLRCTFVVNKRVEDFKKRMKPEIGKVFDPLRDTISHLKTDHLFGVVIPVDEFTVRDLLSPESTKSNTATTTTTSTTSDVLTKKITFEQFGGSKPVRPMKVRVGALLPQFIDDKFTYGDPTIKLNHRLGPNMFKKLGDRNNYGDELNAKSLLHPTPEGIYGGNYITFRNAFKNNNHTAPASPPSIYSKSPERQLRNDDRSMKTCPVLAFTNTEERIRKLGMGRLAVSS